MVSFFIKAYGFKEIHPMDGVRRQTPDDSVHRRRRVRLANVRGAMTTLAIIFLCLFLLVSIISLTLLKINMEYRDTVKCLTTRIGNQVDTIEKTAKELKMLQYTYDSLVGFMESPVKTDLRAIPHFNPDTNMVDSVYVKAFEISGSYGFIIKTFVVENPEDEEDVAFAAREAEELIEILNEA